MKIYNISEIPEGLRAPSYEEVLLSGYTDGYEDGYNSIPCYHKMYLTIEATGDGSISVSKNLEYSINGGPWVSVTSGGSINVSSGDKTRFKGINAGNGTFVWTGVRSIVYGNIMSIMYGDEYIGKTSIPSGQSFESCFSSANITDASNLVLPATTVPKKGYRHMFAACGNLVTAPELPALVFEGQECYAGMFQGCQNLVNAPALPAETLSLACYDSMFSECTSLTTAPELPATTLAGMCYDSMFRGCTSITVAPALPATELDYGCYNNMFYGCTSLVEAPELPSTTLHSNCYSGMFEGCTSLVEAPELPATNLDNNPGMMLQYNYANMFRGCTSLVTAPELPAWHLSNACYKDMFAGCTSLVNAPVLNAEFIFPNSYDGMFSGCTSLEYVECMAKSHSVNDTTYTGNWMDGVPANGVFKCDCEYNWSRDSSGIPAGWTVIDNCPHYEEKYFTVEALSDGQGTIPRGVRWRMNDGDWNASADTDTMVSMVRGDKIEMSRVADTAYALFSGKTMPSYEVYGNAMSLIYGDDYLGQDTIPSGTGFVQGFSSCFSGQTSLVSAENLVLPATALTEYCYTTMFSECSSLTGVPELPATELAYRCYYFMFGDCTSLTTAPELPATTLAEDCYQSMFIRCSNLVNAPELPAEMLVSGCYANLFYGCSALDEITCLAVNNVGDTGVTDWWVSGVSATGTFYCPCRDIWSRGVFGIPNGWDVVDECPHYQDSAMTVEYLETKSNYNFPVGWEISINGGPWVMSNTVSGVTAGDKVQFRAYWDEEAQAYHFGASFFLMMDARTRFNVYGNIMSLVDPVNFASTTTIPEFEDEGFRRFFAGSRVVDASNLILPATGLTDYCYEMMFQGCIYLSAAPALPATTMAYGCYKQMFQGCNSLTTAPELPATTLGYECYEGMFKNCTSLTAAPDLLAKYTEYRSYDEMFRGCTNLNYVKCMADEGYFENWLKDVSPTGTCVIDWDCSWWEAGDSGIPEGWTIEYVNEP